MKNTTTSPPPPREAPVTDHPTCGPDADAPQQTAPAEDRINGACVAYANVILKYGYAGAAPEKRSLIAAVRAATLADVERVVEGIGSAYPDDYGIDAVLVAISAMRETP